MRIALLHTRYARSGGVEKYISTLADRLLAHGHEVHYFSGRPSAGVDLPAGLHFHALGRIRWPEALKPLAYAAFTAAALRRAERSTPFDVVHGFSSTGDQDVYTDGSGAALDFNRLRAPVADSGAGRVWASLAPRRLAALHLERRRFRSPRLRRVLAMSRLVRDQILARHPLPPDRVEVLYPPVDLEEFHPRRRADARESIRRALDTPPGALAALFTGNGFLRKGLDVLIDALGARPGRQWVLWVAGRDRRGRRFIRRAADRGVAARFLGFRADMTELCAGADAFVLPSRFDAFGAAALEAMAAGLPVIVSARAGASEVVEDGVSGLVWRKGDGSKGEGSAALAALLEPLEDAARREAMGAAARSAAEAHGWDFHLPRLLSVYDELARERRETGVPCRP